MGLEPASVRLLTLSNIEISKTSGPIAIKIYMKSSIIGVMERQKNAKQCKKKKKKKKKEEKIK